jgi:HlyD family secretion protein
MLRLLQRSPKATDPAAVAADEPMPLALLEFQSPTAAIIATPMPAIARRITLWITLLVFALLFIAWVMPVDEVVTATGELDSMAPTASIQAFTTSIVRQINVQPGQLVHKGDVLATLDPTYASADLTALTAQEQAYSAEVARLTAQESGKIYFGDPANPASALQISTYSQQQGQYNYTMQDYQEKIKELQTQIDGFNSQAAFYEERLGIATNVESMRKDLQKLQVGSRLDTLAATDDRLNMQSELASAQSSAAAAERDLAAQQAEMKSFDQQWKATVSQQLSDAINNLTQAEQGLAKAKLDDQLVVLTAPQDSIVQSVAATSTGSVLQSGSELMELVPVNAPLTVDVEVDGTNSGYIQVGDEAVIKFATLPFLHNGTAQGIVQSVSPSSFNPSAASPNSVSGPQLPGGPQDLYYKAYISLDVLNIHNTPDGFQLTPGMPLEADVKIGKRTILAFFTQRIMPVAYESFHEP